MRQVLVFLVAVLVVVILLRQVRKPWGWPGRFFLWFMNLNHSELTDWGLQHIVIEKNSQILDVGCGGGRTIEKLANMATEGKVFGVDYSWTSVAAATRKNNALVKADKVEIQQATVSSLPYPDQMFDLVTAVETHYYWPDRVADMSEVLRVLKPGGKFVVIAEAYKQNRSDLTGVVMKAISAAYLSVDEHVELFRAAGYDDIQTFEDRSHGWFCAVVASTGRNNSKKSGLNLKQEPQTLN